jgi:hypothetical protein
MPIARHDGLPARILVNTGVFRLQCVLQEINPFMGFRFHHAANLMLVI